MLFIWPIRSLLPQMNREPISINNDDAQYEALKVCQNKSVKKKDTHKDSLSFPKGSTVALQHEDGGPWMHRVIDEVNNSDHKGRSYIIRVVTMSRPITWNRRHICSSPVTTEKYLWEQIKRELGN